MFERRDISSTRRAATDLLRWSMGSKPRYGQDYVEYKAPPNPATPPPTVARTVGAARRHARGGALGALRAVLLWWLSFDEKDGRRQG